MALGYVRRAGFLALRARAPRTTLRLASLLFTRLLPFESELPLLASILRLRPGLVVDVGANAGIYAAFLARYAARVVAVEPNPTEAEFLRRSLPPHVVVAEVALSDHVGRARLVVLVTARGLPLSPLASLDRAGG